MTQLQASLRPIAPGRFGWFAALAANRWPDRARVEVIGWMMLAAYLPMLAKVYAEAIGHVGSDFMAFWGAGRLVDMGQPWAAYDLASEQAIQGASHTGQLSAYVNPPPYLLLAAPLGLLRYAAAWIVWAFGGWLLWYGVSRRLLPDLPQAIIVAPVAYLAASHAQNGFVTGALLAGGVMAIARGRDRLGGALLGLLVIKPHLALLVPLWLVAARRWRAVAAAAGSASGLCALSLALFGWRTWQAWPQAFAVSAQLLAQTTGPFFMRMATPYALLRATANPNVAFAGQAAIALAMAALVWRRARKHGAGLGSGALMLAATALASPYLFSYDLPFLIVPQLWLVIAAREHGWRPWEKPAVVALWLAPLATRVAALPFHANLMPLAAAALVWLVTTRLDQSTISGWSGASAGSSRPTARGSANTST